MEAAFPGEEVVNYLRLFLRGCPRAARVLFRALEISVPCLATCVEAATEDAGADVRKVGGA
eukprot:2318676-Prymnesium_polylepis.1